jgi:uncharacterized protein
MLISAKGHANITATHNTTFEITTARHVGKNGDCLIAVEAVYDVNELKALASKASKIRITLESEGITDEILAETNNLFDDATEIVVRTGEYKSNRTLGIKATKSAAQIKRELVDNLSLGKKLEVKIDAL